MYPRTTDTVANRALNSGNSGVATPCGSWSRLLHIECHRRLLIAVSERVLPTL